MISDKAKARLAVLALAGIAVVVVGYWALVLSTQPGPPRIEIVNDSATPLRNVVVHVTSPGNNISSVSCGVIMPGSTWVRDFDNQAVVICDRVEFDYSDEERIVPVTWNLKLNDVARITVDLNGTGSAGLGMRGSEAFLPIP